MSDEFPLPRRVRVNGLRLSVHEQGSGRPLILLHGFPELAYSWRHQLPALAAAGYHAIAPDQRGYGGSDKPEGVAEYSMQKLIGDVLGLMRAYGVGKALFAGHDLGALLLWHMALSHPERISGMIMLNVPFYASPAADPVGLMRELLGENFYIVNFQDSDEADRRFARDVPHFFDILMRRHQITRARYDQLPADRKVLSLLAAMDRKESAGVPLLTPAERQVFVSAFEAGGFRGPINWYRNWSRNWENYRHFPQVIEVPTLFIGAVDDVIVSPQHIEAMKPRVRDLELHMLDDCGHWTQQEQPQRVNELMLDWLGRRFPA